MMTPDPGTRIGRLCAFCKYRKAASYYCVRGWLQGTDLLCEQDAPWAIVKGKVITYKNFYSKGRDHDEVTECQNGKDVLHTGD